MEKIESYLLTIYGIGEQTVKKISSLLINAKPELLHNSTPTKIRAELRKLPNLSAMTLADLQYNPRKRIPYATMREIDEEFHSKLLGKVKYTIAGSYRRCAKVSGDVDIMYIGQFANMQALFNRLSKNGQIMPPYASGNHKITTMIKWKNRYYKGDFYNTTREAWPLMLVHLTGNHLFNIFLRTEAQKKGMLLNQYGLFKNGKPIKVSSEKKLFQLLGVRYHKPQERSI